MLVAREKIPAVWMTDQLSSRFRLKLQTLTSHFCFSSASWTVIRIRKVRSSVFSFRTAVSESEAACEGIVFPTDASRHLGMQKGDVHHGLASIVKGFQSVSILFCVSSCRKTHAHVQHGEKSERGEGTSGEALERGSAAGGHPSYIRISPLSLSPSRLAHKHVATTTRTTTATMSVCCSPRERCVGERTSASEREKETENVRG